MGATTTVIDELQRYLELTPKSRSLWEESQEYMPGGDTRSSIYWPPYPVFAAEGEGCILRDIDSVERVDFANGMTSLILGHANPAVVKAVQQQVLRGSTYSAPNEHQVRLARLLCQRIPSVELVRFTNSGTEATMNALRAARAFTGRIRFAKCEGGYHGTHDAVEVSVRTDPRLAGDPRRPLAVAAVEGMPSEAVEHVVVLPFNDTDSARQILEEHQGELAAVIVEPVQGGSGMIPADPDFLKILREFTRDDGALLIFDEIITLRVAPGGAQEYYGVTPDMTALGKVIGGGYPVGAFGGRGDIMELFDPTRGPKVAHAGTFNANPITMVAGAATIEQLEPPVYTRLAALTERLRKGVEGVAAELEVPVQVTGLGSLFAIHFTDRPIRTFRDVATSNIELRQRLFWGLLNEGIFPTSKLTLCLSTPMGEQEVDTFVDAFHRVLARNIGG